MTIAVRYLSKTGNTRKLAEAIAGKLGVTAEDLQSPLADPVDVLFLGTAVYAAGVDDKVKEFLHENEEQIGLLAGFSTSALLAGTDRYITRICDNEGIPMAEETYHCKGKFGPMHTGRPHEKDCELAASWAENLLESMGMEYKDRKEVS